MLKQSVCICIVWLFACHPNENQAIAVQPLNKPTNGVSMDLEVLPLANNRYCVFALTSDSFLADTYHAEFNIPENAKKINQPSMCELTQQAESRTVIAAELIESDAPLTETSVLLTWVLDGQTYRVARTWQAPIVLVNAKYKTRSVTERQIKEPIVRDGLHIIHINGD